jgi:hypothetical protein
MEQERILQTSIDREHVNRTRTRPSIWTTREGTTISSAEAACANDRIGAVIPNPTTKYELQGEKKFRAGGKSPSSNLHDGAKPESLEQNNRLQQQQTKHNTPAKPLNKQTNKAEKRKRKTKLRNKHQTKKGVEELLRGCPSAIAVNRAAKLVTRNCQ